MGAFPDFGDPNFEVLAHPLGGGEGTLHHFLHYSNTRCIWKETSMHRPLTWLAVSASLLVCTVETITGVGMQASLAWLINKSPSAAAWTLLGPFLKEEDIFDMPSINI